MSDYNKAREQIELANEIVNGKLRSHQVQKRLRAMREKHKEPFSSYIPTKKEKPWDAAYLKCLGESIPFGGGSEAQFIYMAEVADEVYKIRRIIKNCVLVVASLTALVVLVAVVLRLLGKGS